MLVGARVRPGLPFSLLAVVAATIAGPGRSPLGAGRSATIPRGLPAPSLGFVDPAAFGAMLPSALAVAALAALESLLSATVADGMSVNHTPRPRPRALRPGPGEPRRAGVRRRPRDRRDRPHRRQRPRRRVVEAVGASSTRSCWRRSSSSPAPLVALIPLAALAGVLFATAVQMIESASLLALARSTRADAAVLALTFTVTVAVDLVTAVAVGVGVAVVLALRAVAARRALDEVPLETGDHRRRGARAARRAHRRLPARRAARSSPPPTVSCSS